MKKQICSITGQEYTGYGNNAYPFEGRCCDEANYKYVIPARVAGITPEQIKGAGGNKAFRKLFDTNKAFKGLKEFGIGYWNDVPRINRLVKEHFETKSE
jgi:hypothetical protein